MKRKVQENLADHQSDLSFNLSTINTENSANNRDHHNTDAKKPLGIFVYLMDWK